jgi:hypothetical protein
MVPMSRLGFMRQAVRERHVMTLEAFLRSSGLSPFEREVLWSLVAHAMRSHPTAHGIALTELLEPFSNFLTQIGTDTTKLDVVANELKDGEFKFPFGSLLVESGVVDRIDLTA